MSEKRTSRVDWDAIEPHYRAGVRPLREIAREFDCSDAAIIKHAKSAGWTRNLGGKIQARADAKVAQALVAAERASEPQAKLTEAVRVEVEAEVQARVRVSHRKLLTKLREETDKLIAELMGEELKTRVTCIKALAETAAKLLPLERQAYGIDKLVEDPDDPAATDPVEGARRIAFALARAARSLPPTS